MDYTDEQRQAFADMLRIPVERVSDGMLASAAPPELLRRHGPCACAKHRWNPECPRHGREAIGGLGAR